MDAAGLDDLSLPLTASCFGKMALAGVFEYHRTQKVSCDLLFLGNVVNLPF